MAYYVINKNTNQINPNAITGEVALYQTEADYLKANNSNYRPATNIEKQKYIEDCVAYRLSKETETKIWVINKDQSSGISIFETDMASYITGQVQEEVEGLAFKYQKAPAGELLDDAIKNNQNSEKNNILNDVILQATKLLSQIRNLIVVDSITYSIKNSKPKPKDKRERITMDGIDFVRTYDEANILSSSEQDPISIVDTYDLLQIVTSKQVLLNVIQGLSITKTNQTLLYSKYTSSINNIITKLKYSCESDDYETFKLKATDTNDELNRIFTFLQDTKNSDVDEVKDGKTTITLESKDLKIYDLRHSLDVMMGDIELEDTNITDIVLDYSLENDANIQNYILDYKTKKYIYVERSLLNTII